MIDPQVLAAYRALQNQGWEGDQPTLEAAIKKLDYGLPAEDEFSLLLSWLGRCRLVHPLGQEQTPPESVQSYRVPDLLAVFDYEGRSIVVLVEVKSTRKRKLSWKEDYLEALRCYGETLGLPVLVAWKHPPIGFWALVHIQCFRRAARNYHLDFETAMEQNLMGMLAGDFGIDFAPGFGMHIKMNKLSGQSDEGWHVKVEEAYFEGPQGHRFTELKGGLWPLLTTLDHEADLQESATQLHQSFVVRPESAIQFAHRAFPALLQWPAALGKRPRWRQLLRQHRFPVSVTDLRRGAEAVSSYGVVRRFIRQVPAETPAFLK